MSAMRANLDDFLERRGLRHGTRFAYTSGCRCADCTAANARYHARRRAQLSDAAREGLKRRPKRTCGHDGCTTLLARDNDSDRCSVHQRVI